MYFTSIAENTLVYCLRVNYLVYYLCGKYIILLSLRTLLSLFSLWTTYSVNMTKSKSTTVIQEYVEFNSWQTCLLFLFYNVVFMTAYPLGVIHMFQCWYLTRLQDPILDLLRTWIASWFNFQIWIWTSKVELLVALSFRSSTKLVVPINSLYPTRLWRSVWL